MLPLRFLSTAVASGVGLGLLWPTALNPLYSRFGLLTALIAVAVDALVGLSYFLPAMDGPD